MHSIFTSKSSNYMSWFLITVKSVSNSSFS